MDLLSHQESRKEKVSRNTSHASHTALIYFYSTKHYMLTADPTKGPWRLTVISLHPSSEKKYLSYSHLFLSYPQNIRKTTFEFSHLIVPYCTLTPFC